MNEIKKIKGTYKSTIFESQTNNYKVISIAPEGDGPTTINGDIDIDLKRNVIYHFYGEEIVDAKYGTQLKVANIETELYGEEAFLDIFKRRRLGTTKSKLINDIYTSLGETSVAKIINDPSVLDKFEMDDATKSLIVDAIYDSAEYHMIENYIDGLPIDNGDRKRLHDQISKMTLSINIKSMYAFEENMRNIIKNDTQIDYEKGSSNLAEAFKVLTRIINKYPEVLNYDSEVVIQYKFDDSILDVIKDAEFDFIVEKPEEMTVIDKETTKIKGSVKKIIFQNESGFKIIAVKTKRNGEITMKGNVDVNEGMHYVFHGALSVDPKYGNQFTISETHIEVNSKNAIRDFLSSKEFEGVGSATIDKIYDHFGLNAIDILLENGSRIYEVDGITEKAKKSIKAGMISKGAELKIINKIDNPIARPREIKIVANAIKTLSSKIHWYDRAQTPVSEWELPKDVVSALTDGQIPITIDKENGEDIDVVQTAIDIFKYDPFVVIDCSFELNLKFELLNKYFLLYNGDTRVSSSRFESAIEWYGKKTIQQGFSSPYNSSTLFPIGILMDSLTAQFPSYNVRELMTELNPKNIKVSNDCFMLTEDYENEAKLAECIANLIAQPSNENIDPDVVESIISEQEKVNGFNYHDIQKKAIKEACMNKVFIVTGGPGTGKTTVARGVIDAVCTIHGIPDSHTSLCAPTGKAARRIKNQTGREATTIHSLIGDKGGGPEYNEDKKLDTRLLVIDESSMNDTKLMLNLLLAINDTTRVIIIGDDDQLPSIGPGKVLNDMINCKEISSVMLEATFRQGEGSPITELAIQVNSGIPLSVVPRPGLEIKNVKASTEYLASMIVNELESHHATDPLFENVQVLCSTNNIVDMVNLEMQSRNKSTESFELPGESSKALKVRLNDKVMCCKNNHGIDLCNGDIGVVTQFVMPSSDQNIRTTSPIAIIEFAHKTIYVQTQPNKRQKANLEEFVSAKDLASGEIEITKADEMPAMRLGYAVTIHKSQGSEWPNVIMTPGNSSFGTRKLVYTGITRAKENLTLIGDMSQVQNMAMHGDAPRYTNLGPMLSYTIDKVLNQKISQ